MGCVPVALLESFSLRGRHQFPPSRSCTDFRAEPRCHELESHAFNVWVAWIRPTPSESQLPGGPHGPALQGVPLLVVDGFQKFRTLSLLRTTPAHQTVNLCCWAPNRSRVGAWACVLDVPRQPLVEDRAPLVLSNFLLAVGALARAGLETRKPLGEAAEVEGVAAARELEGGMEGAPRFVLCCLHGGTSG